MNNLQMFSLDVLLKHLEFINFKYLLSHFLHAQPSESGTIEIIWEHLG